jgi:hypothetical protein
MIKPNQKKTDKNNLIKPSFLNISPKLSNCNKKYKKMSFKSHHSKKNYNYQRSKNKNKIPQSSNFS